MQQILAKLAAEKHLVGLDAEHLVDCAEGDGRTQRKFIRELGLKAGDYTDWTPTSAEKMIAASRLSHLSSESSLFASLIRECIRRG